jgi:hypothetical protein
VGKQSRKTLRLSNQPAPIKRDTKHPEKKVGFREKKRGKGEPNLPKHNSDLEETKNNHCVAGTEPQEVRGRSNHAQWDRYAEREPFGEVITIPVRSTSYNFKTSTKSVRQEMPPMVP